MFLDIDLVFGLVPFKYNILHKLHCSYIISIVQIYGYKRKPYHAGLDLEEGEAGNRPRDWPGPCAERPKPRATGVWIARGDYWKK